MARRPVTREIATTLDGRDITRPYTGPLLQPLDRVLQQRGGGDLTIYEEILRDDQVKTGLTQRHSAVVAAEWEVEPAGPTARDEEAAAFLRTQLGRVKFDQVFEKMLFGTFYGYAVAEVLWAPEGNRVVFDAIKVRNRRRFRWGNDGRLKMLTPTKPLGEDLPDGKFWTFAVGADHDDEPYGLGLAHWLYWPCFFKRQGVSAFLTFLDRYATPTAKGTFPPNTSDADKETLLDALEAIHQDSGIIIPEGMRIELVEAQRSGTPDYAALLDRMDRAITKVILGHSGTTDSTPGRLGGEDTAVDVRGDLVKADADVICHSFNDGPAAWLTAYNFPELEPPKVWRWIDSGTDLKHEAEIMDTVSRVGYRPTLQRVQEVFGGEWEEKPAPAPSYGPAFAEAVNFQEPVDDPVPALADRMEDEADGALDAVIDALGAEIGRALTLEALADRLEGDAFAALDGEALARAIALGVIVADLSGRSEVEDEASFAAATDLPFLEAVTFLRDKVNVPTEKWTDMMRSAHDVGFTVAGATKAELLSDFREAVRKSIEDGTTLRDFRRDFDAIVERHGWSYKGSRRWRSRTIYETNLRTAYAAGRYAQMTDPDVMQRRPYWQYRHGGSADPRESHLAMDGMVLPAEDPTWNEIYPPNGWGCSCKVFALSDRDLARMGKAGPDTPPDRATRNRAISRGWDYAPGRSVAERVREHTREKIDQLPGRLGQLLLEDMRSAAERDVDPAIFGAGS